MQFELAYSDTAATTTIRLISLVAMLILPFFGFLSDKVGRRISFVISAVIGLIATIFLGVFAIVIPIRDLAVLALFIIPSGDKTFLGLFGGLMGSIFAGLIFYGSFSFLIKSPELENVFAVVKKSIRIK